MKRIRFNRVLVIAMIGVGALFTLGTAYTIVMAPQNGIPGRSSRSENVFARTADIGYPGSKWERPAMFSAGPFSGKLTRCEVTVGLTGTTQIEASVSFEEQAEGAWTLVPLAPGEINHQDLGRYTLLPEVYDYKDDGMTITGDRDRFEAVRPTIPSDRDYINNTEPTCDIMAVPS